MKKKKNLKPILIISSIALAIIILAIISLKPLGIIVRTSSQDFCNSNMPVQKEIGPWTYCDGCDVRCPGFNNQYAFVCYDSLRDTARYDYMDACDAGAQCTSHFDQRCWSGNVYWYNSCGVREELTIRCDYGCEAGNCIIPSCTDCPDRCQGSNRQYNGRCIGTQGTCFYDTQYCQAGCMNGQCNDPPCTSNWQCADWGPCINGLRTRTCNDLNECYQGQPETTQECQVNCQAPAPTCADGSSANCVCNFNTGQWECPPDSCSYCMDVPSRPCDQAVWQDYPICQYDTTLCTEICFQNEYPLFGLCLSKTIVWIIIFILVSIIGYSIYALRKKK